MAQCEQQEELAYKLIVIGDSGVGKSNIALRYCDDMFFADGVTTLGIDFKYTRCTLLSETDVKAVAVGWTPTAADRAAEVEGGSAGGTVLSSSSAMDQRNNQMDAGGPPPDSGGDSICSPPLEYPQQVRVQVWDTAGHDRFATLTAGFYRSSQGIMLCFDLTNRSSFEHLDVWYERIRDNVGSRMPPMLLVGCKVDLVDIALSGGGSPARRSGGGGGGVAALKTPEPHVRPGSTGLLLRGDNYGFRQVDGAEAEAWAREHGALCYLETSAKENVNVTYAFQILATVMARSNAALPPRRQQSGDGRPKRGPSVGGAAVGSGSKEGKEGPTKRSCPC